MKVTSPEDKELTFKERLIQDIEQRFKDAPNGKNAYRIIIRESMHSTIRNSIKSIYEQAGWDVECSYSGADSTKKHTTFIFKRK